MNLEALVKGRKGPGLVPQLVLALAQYLVGLPEGRIGLRRRLEMRNRLGVVALLIEGEPDPVIVPGRLAHGLGRQQDEERRLKERSQKAGPKTEWARLAHETYPLFRNYALGITHPSYPLVLLFSPSPLEGEGWDEGEFHQ